MPKAGIDCRAQRTSAAQSPGKQPKKSFAGRYRPQGEETGKRFDAIVAGFYAEQAAALQKGIRFDMTQEQYWLKVEDREPNS